MQIKSLGNKAAFIMVVAGAAVIGGATTAIVTAAIPSTADGKIHACYRNSASLTDVKGALRVIDSQATPAQTCNAQETALNWDQIQSASGSSGLTIKDNNGQVLGTIVAYKSVTQKGNNITEQGMMVYNPTLKRVLNIGQSSLSNDSTYGSPFSPVYTTSDCTGQPYLANYAYLTPKTSLYQLPANSGPVYAIVQDSASATSMTYESTLVYGDDGTSTVCLPQEDTIGLFPLTTVTMPFTTPISLPLKF